MERKPLITITKDQLKWQYFRAGGKGGQNQNKTSSGVRVTHPPSGAVGESRTSRSQHENRRLALNRMVRTPKFKFWLAEAHHTIIKGKTVEEEVAEEMAPENIRVEVKSNGRWVDET